MIDKRSDGDTIPQEAQEANKLAKKKGSTKVSLNADSLIDAMDWDSGDWRRASACKDTDPEMFFPIGQTGMALEQIAYAKAICAGCPVQRQCLEYALTSNQEAGVWGGATEEERRIIRRARRNSSRISAAASQAS